MVYRHARLARAQDWRDLWPAVTTGHRRRLGLILLVLLFLLAFRGRLISAPAAWAMAESRQLVFAPMAASVADFRAMGPVAQGDTLVWFAIPELAIVSAGRDPAFKALNQRLTGQVADETTLAERQATGRLGEQNRRATLNSGRAGAIAGRSPNSMASGGMSIPVSARDLAGVRDLVGHRH